MNQSLEQHRGMTQAQIADTSISCRYLIHWPHARCMFDDIYWGYTRYALRVSVAATRMTIHLSERSPFLSLDLKSTCMSRILDFEVHSSAY